MDSILSVQKTDFTRDGKEFTKVPRVVTNVKSYLYGQFSGIWKNLVKIYHGIIEIQHLIDQRQVASLKEPYEGTFAVLLQSGLDEKWWAVFDGMLLPSAKCPRPPGRWKNPCVVRRNTQKPTDSFWDKGRTLSDFCTR